MMPIDSRAAAIPGHDHCQDASLVSVSEDGKSSSNANVAHYCCAVVAILVIPPEFSASNQVDVHLQGNVSTPASNIVESIYKPPRNYP
jgi:hypothetical protein